MCVLKCLEYKTQEGVLWNVIAHYVTDKSNRVTINPNKKWRFIIFSCQSTLGISTGDVW